MELHNDKNDAPQYTEPLVKAIASTPQAAEFYLGLVRPLQEHDHAHTGDLVSTLFSYLYHGGNVTHAAKALYLHRSTLLSRLSRITALTSLDLSDPYVRLALWIGVLLTKNI